FDNHVHALNDITLGIALEGDDAFEAQNARAVCLGYFLDPGEETVRVHFTATQGNRLYRDIMDCRNIAMVMVAMVVVVMIVSIMVMVVMPMVMIVVVMAAIGTADMVFMAMLKEVRIVFQCTFKVERALIENTSQINAGAG